MLFGSFVYWYWVFCCLDSFGCSICIFFLAKEGPNCSLTSLKPHIYMPVRVHFEKGLGQKFQQAPGTGVDLSLFDEKELLKGGSQENVFPLVVRTEAVPKSPFADVSSRENESLGAPLPNWVHSQTTQAVIEKKDDGSYHVRVVKQIIWVGGIRYELQEIYGIENSRGGGEFDDSDIGKECVICMSEPRDTTVLPCRHMVCMTALGFLLFDGRECTNIRCGIGILICTSVLWLAGWVLSLKWIMWSPSFQWYQFLLPDFLFLA